MKRFPESTSDSRTPAAGVDAAAEHANPVNSASLRGGAGRRLQNRYFFWLCLATAGLSVVILLFLLSSILIQGAPSLTATLLTNGPQPDPAQAGIRPALFGTIWVCGLCGLFTLPVGVATAILLEEYKPKRKLARVLHALVQLNISNLAGVPSVVYGILGLTAFAGMFGFFASATRPGQPGIEFGVRYYDQFFSEGERAILVPVDGPDAPATVPQAGMQAMDFDHDPIEVNVLQPGDPYPEDESVLQYTLWADAEAGRNADKAWYYVQLPLGRGVLTGALTLMLVILPVVIISAQESLRAVPSSLRAGALGLGATPWQVVWNVTLPSAIPGIMTGSILAMSRAIGEAAPILMIAGIVYINRAPQHLMDDFTVMPLQIYNWTSRPQEAFHHLAAAGIIILLLILLSFNAVAVLIRYKMQKPLS